MNSKNKNKKAVYVAKMSLIALGNIAWFIFPKTYKDGFEIVCIYRVI